MKVHIAGKAYFEMAKISLYIKNKGYPETAHRLYDRMIDFAFSLGDFPEKYAVCRFPQFAKRGYHCAVFEGNYIFVYTINDNQLNVLHVVSSKKMKV
jgi:hypothetical protein